jgi:MFS family permease
LFRQKGAGRWVAALAVVGQLMVMLDIAVVNVASPAVRAALGFSAPGVQWVASICTLTFAGLLIIGGRVAGLYGCRRALLAGLTAFMIASVAGGLARAAAPFLTRKVPAGDPAGPGRVRAR